MVRVLVVDDEEPITSLLRDVLEDEGHTVLVARDGQQGLALARAHAPDIVLTDNMMPRLSGLELVQTLLDDPPVPQMMLIVMSAAHVPGLAVLTTVTFIAKPFKLDTVLALVAAAR